MGLVVLVNEFTKSDQKDLKGRKETSRMHSQTLCKVYTGYTHARLHTLSRTIPTYPQRSSDSRSLSTTPQMNLPRKNARQAA